MEYPTTAEAHDDNYYNYTSERVSKVAIDGTDFYIQGILPQCPYGWTKGTITTVPGASATVPKASAAMPEASASGTTIIFPTGQNFGVDETKDLDGNVFFSHQYFFVGANIETGTIEDVRMIYDAEKDYYELQNELLVNNSEAHQKSGLLCTNAREAVNNRMITNHHILYFFASMAWQAVMATR